MSRIAVISILLEDQKIAQQVNDVLYAFGSVIIGRMGLPYPKRSLNIISIVVDAPNDVINTISGRIGKIKGATTKTLYSKEFTDE